MPEHVVEKKERVHFHRQLADFQITQLDKGKMLILCRLLLHGGQLPVTFFMVKVRYAPMVFYVDALFGKYVMDTVSVYCLIPFAFQPCFGPFAVSLTV